MGQTWSTSGSDIFNANTGNVIIDDGSVLRGPGSGAFTIQSTSGDAILFNTNGASERMRITSAGNVGIQTTAPAQELHVAGDIKTDGIYYGPDSTSLTLQAISNRAIVFNTNGSNERARFKDTGELYVNLTSLPSCDASSPVKNKWECKNSRFYVDRTSTPSDESAIRGIARATAANPIGVWGATNATGSSGGQPMGVRGDATSSSPADGQFGVLGYNWATTQTAGFWGAGVWGGSVGEPGHEGAFSGRGHGVMGETYSTATGAAGVFGSSRATTGTNFGVFGSSISTSGGAGVKGHNDAATGTGDGVTGLNDSGDAGSYGVEYSGGLGGSGTKSAIVYTDMQGPTELYALETPDNLFEDVGEGVLVDGRATILLDPLFLETVTINEENPMQVFIQMYGDADVYVQRGADAFTVIEKGDDLSNGIAFAYRVVAKREFYEDVRLRATTVSVDTYMRPDLSNAEIDELNSQLGLPLRYQSE